jgi:DnaK suppressor protein
MDLNKQKAALLKTRAETLDLLNSTRGRDDGETLTDESPVDSDIPTHDADRGTATFERERDDAFIRDYEGLIERIDQALAKIDNGTYGICEVCGKRIPDDRMEAEPYALLCIEDQEADESM